MKGRRYKRFATLVPHPPGLVPADAWAIPLPTTIIKAPYNPG